MTDKWKDGCIEVLKSDRLLAPAPPPPHTHTKSSDANGTKVILLYQSNRIDF
jgi:hypothetical protein